MYHHFDVDLRNLRGDGWHPMIWGKDFITGWNPSGPTADKLQHVWDVQDENVPTIQIGTLADSVGVSNRDHAIIHHTVVTH